MTPHQIDATSHQIDAVIHAGREETRRCRWRSSPDDAEPGGLSWELPSCQVEGMGSLRFEALGGECELYAVGPREPLEATAEWIRGLHRRLTRFETDSELSRFNARAGEWIEVSQELEALLRAALQGFQESDGLVNAAVLPALIAAGYDRTFDELALATPEPALTVSVQGTPGTLHRSDADVHRFDALFRASSEDIPRRVGEVRETRAVAPLPDLLDVRPRSARLAPGAAIDLGGLAKGWIADRAVERMGANSLANCGGDLRAVGGGESGEGWPVAFGGKTLLLTDHGAATSGTTKRRWGDGFHHLIDPRTGAAADSDLSEVSVLARTALDAEILAKTALLLGSERAPRALEGRALAWALT